MGFHQSKWSNGIATALMTGKMQPLSACIFSLIAFISKKLSLFILYIYVRETSNFVSDNIARP